MDCRVKILAHVGAIVFLLLGVVLLHVVVNHHPYVCGDQIVYTNIQFFDISLSRYVVMDIGFVLLGIGFFIEFLMTFKPIQLLTQEVRKNE